MKNSNNSLRSIVMTDYLWRRTNSFNPIIREVVDSTLSSDTTTDNPIIRGIIDKVKDGITAQEIQDIFKEIIRSDLDIADIITALDNEVTVGHPLTPSESFLTHSSFGCPPTLSSVIASQFGIHVPAGVLELRAILDGSLNLPTPYHQSFDAVAKICFPMTNRDGTGILDHIITLKRLTVPVDIDYNATPAKIQEALAQGKRVMVSVYSSSIWPGEKGNYLVVQVLEIDVDSGTITTLDTGSRDDKGEPDGNGKVYNLDAFEAARILAGYVMVSTREPAPSTVPEEGAAVDNMEPTQRTPGAGVAIKVVAGGQVIDADEELIALLSESTLLGGETRTGETDGAEGSEPSSGNSSTATSSGAVLSKEFDNGDIEANSDNPATSSGAVLSKEFDEGNPTKEDNTKEDTPLSTSKDQSTNQVSVNAADTSLTEPSNTDDGGGVGEVEVFGTGS